MSTNNMASHNMRVQNYQAWKIFSKKNHDSSSPDAMKSEKQSDIPDDVSVSSSTSVDLEVSNIITVNIPQPEPEFRRNRLSKYLGDDYFDFYISDLDTDDDESIGLPADSTKDEDYPELSDDEPDDDMDYDPNPEITQASDEYFENLHAATDSRCNELLPNKFRL